MRVKYFYPWGYFYPVASGSDRVAANHLEYFRTKGWSVDCILADEYDRRNCAAQFHEQYPWIDSVTVLHRPNCAFTLRDMLFAYDQGAQAPPVRTRLGRPADLFLTNYVFSTPLVQYLPPGCKRILEAIDIMSHQFALHRPPIQLDTLEAGRRAFDLRTEVELYQLYDSVLMINPQELEFVRSLPMTRATYVPQMCTEIATHTESSAQEPEFDLLFIGSGVPINVRGITWFYERVFIPYLRRRGIRLAIAGNVCQHLDFHDAQVVRLFRVEGSLRDLYAAAKIVVVPIFEGTGLSIKTLEGLAMGRPVVTTPPGARGLSHGAEAFVQVDMHADARGTAEIVEELLANPGRREQLGEAATRFVQQCFSREAYFDALDGVMRTIGILPADRSAA